MTADKLAEYEERAAIMEFDGGMTREAAERAAWLEVFGTAPWQRVIFAADCEPDGMCPVCEDDYADCPCPGPTQDDEYEYRDHDGVLQARRKEVVV